MIGMPAPGHIDLTPFWYQEVRLTGSYTYATERYQGTDVSTFQLALQLMRREELSSTLADWCATPSLCATIAGPSPRRCVLDGIKPSRLSSTWRMTE